MKIERKDINRLCAVLLLCLMQVAGIAVYGQDTPRAAAKRLHQLQPKDTLSAPRPRRLPAAADTTDTLSTADSLNLENKRKLLALTANPDLDPAPASTDSLQQVVNPQVWVPNPTKATWMALVIPGGGQIYNRKYWKLPIFYGGFAGCAYALTWNNKMYKDYMQAYKDLKNIGMSASSVQDLLPPRHNYSESQLTEILRKRKDTYRRYRDMSIFAFVAVYLLSVVDAYVDAELSNFDISPDLSMRMEPAIIQNRPMTGNSKQSVGLQCSIRF